MTCARSKASNLLQAFAPCWRRRRVSASAASTDHVAAPPAESLRDTAVTATLSYVRMARGFHACSARSASLHNLQLLSDKGYTFTQISKL
jgi:hypothetical protein